MRRVVGFIPLVFYALGFLLFGGFSLLFFIGAFNADDAGVANRGLICY